MNPNDFILLFCYSCYNYIYFFREHYQSSKIYLIKKELRVLIYEDPTIMNFAFNIDIAIETEQKRKVVKAVFVENRR